MNPIASNIPDIDTQDGSTVERFEYLNGENDVEVQHLKVTGGGHEWPGYKGNMDVNASEEVWNFLKAFDLNGKIE
jgi:polyhydroxybutyrate depolymerase